MRRVCLVPVYEVYLSPLPFQLADLSHFLPLLNTMVVTFNFMVTGVFILSTPKIQFRLFSHCHETGGFSSCHLKKGS